jgi:hypothetical protein
MKRIQPLPVCAGFFICIRECEVGKGKRVDVYLEVRKRRGHIFFE